MAYGIIVGATYAVKVGTRLSPVRILRERDEGGWVGLDENTMREVVITTASVERRFKGQIRPAQKPGKL